MFYKRLICYILIFFLFTACLRRNDNKNNVGKVMAYVPKYISLGAVTDIKIDSPKNTVKAGKIYVFGNYLFQNDVNTGIHIIDISNRANPKKIAFINIPLSAEIAVKGNYLYTNNLADLLTFDISNPTTPVLKNRVKDVFPMPNQSYPPFNQVYFECADATKGVVIDWVLSEVENPKCRR